MGDGFELVGHRQQNQVGDGHPIDGRDKCHRDAAAQLTGISQIAHDVNQAHHRTDDAHGRCIAAHAFEYFGCLNIAGFLSDEVHFEDAANGRRFGTVDQQLQAFAGITVGLGIGHGLQTKQAFLAGRHAPANDPVHPAAGRCAAGR